MCIACRRGFLGAMAAGAASTVLKAPHSLAQQGAAIPAGAASPPGGEFIIRNGYVVTMDPQRGDIPMGAVHVKDGAILDVAPAIDRPGVPTIDASNMIVLPGLVDTHWHMWHTLFRSFAGDTKESGFFPTITRFAKSMAPEDMYQSTRLAGAGAVAAGITTVHDWCHNIRSREHAEADLQALRDVGLRARWSFGQAIDQPLTERIRLDDLRAMHADWGRYSNGGRIGLGMAWRGMFRHGNVSPNVYKAEFDTARQLGLPITVHIGTVAAETVGDLEAHAQAGFLGPDVNVVHATGATPADVDAVRRTGATVSVLPFSEMLAGWGEPSLRQFLAAGLPVALGIDSAVLIGGANLFNVLKLAMGLVNVEAENEFALSPRRALQLGTLDAAALLGLSDRTGSLVPGKRADLIAVSTNALNMGVFTDPARMLIECAAPENVDTVVIDGRILKRGGRLTEIDVPAVLAGGRTSLASVRTAAAWR